MTPSDFFINRAKNNSELEVSTPELIEVIKELRLLQENKVETLFFVDNWLKTKYKDTGSAVIEGENVEYDLDIIDYTERNKFISWMWEYLNHLYTNRKAGKTIGLGYAYNYLTMYCNAEPSIGLGRIIDIPNFTFDDIITAIENEDTHAEILPETLSKSDIDTIKRLCSDKTKNEDIEIFLRCGTSFKLQLRNKILCRDVVDALMPMIDNAYFLFLKKDDTTKRKAEWLNSIFPKFQTKTFRNDITEYNQK